MTDIQLNSLRWILLFIALLFSLSWFAYDQYNLSREEALTYLAVFRPDPNITEFDNIVAVSSPTTCNSNEAIFDEIDNRVIQSFFDSNKQGASPIRLSALEGKVPILSWDDTINIHEHKAINKFKPKAGSLLKLSRAGFNSEMNKALVCVDVVSTGYGQGLYYYLVKTENQWVIVKSGTIWVS